MSATILKFPRHGRLSHTGRGTSAGQSQPSGHFSENQAITSSYLRAVNVRESSSSRSKKRQSPAAKRPIVATLTERAAPYADAHAMRFDRISDSMESEASRTFPTVQAEKVGNFPLAHSPEKSDKSAMPTVDHIRRTIAHAMEKIGEGPITVALDLELERNYLRDFLEGKKNSLKAEVSFALSERYSIPIKELIVSKEKRIRRTG